MRRAIVVVFAIFSLVGPSAGMAWGASSSAPGIAPVLTCSTPLTLYDGANRSGANVHIYTRGVWINLSTVSFDNKTSSFKVGACAVELAAQSNGSGNYYPECLYPGCIENTMLSGWNNVISSVYLY
jgi:hypothetical protein